MTYENRSRVYFVRDTSANHMITRAELTTLLLQIAVKRNNGLTVIDDPSSGINFNLIQRGTLSGHI